MNRAHSSRAPRLTGATSGDRIGFFRAEAARFAALALVITWVIACDGGAETASRPDAQDIGTANDAAEMDSTVDAPPANLPPECIAAAYTDDARETFCASYCLNQSRCADGRMALIERCEMLCSAAVESADEACVEQLSGRERCLETEVCATVLDQERADIACSDDLSGCGAPGEVDQDDRINRACSEWCGFGHRRCFGDVDQSCVDECELSFQALEGSCRDATLRRLDCAAFAECSDLDEENLVRPGGLCWASEMHRLSACEGSPVGDLLFVALVASGRVEVAGMRLRQDGVETPLGIVDLESGVIGDDELGLSACDTPAVFDDGDWIVARFASGVPFGLVGDEIAVEICNASGGASLAIYVIPDGFSPNAGVCRDSFSDEWLVGEIGSVGMQILEVD